MVHLSEPIEEMRKMGTPSFNLCRESGEGLERETINEINLKQAQTFVCASQRQAASAEPSRYFSARQQQAGDKSRYHSVIVDRRKGITCHAVPVYR